MSRSLHLGLDWGTSATKLVLRDNDAVGAQRGRAYVLRNGEGGVRHPSLAVLEGGRLWFGDEAKQRRSKAQQSWSGLKAQVALEGRAAAEALGDLQLRDLASLFLAHMLNVGERAAWNLPGGHDAALGFKLGVPAGEMTNWKYINEYLRIARAAFFIAINEGKEPNGILLERAKMLMRETWEAVQRREARARITGEVVEAWLRPEAASEMIWPLRSPSVPQGLYTAVDVGAGTTNACFFSIHERSQGGFVEQKGAITLFGAACGQPGLNDLLRAALGGAASAEELDEVRGEEDKLLTRAVMKNTSAPRVIEKFRKVWSEAKQEAWHKYRGYGNWDGLRLLVVGGGRNVAPVRQNFERWDPFSPVGDPYRKIKGFQVVKDLGVPDDLRELPENAGEFGLPFREDPTFLFTAYGLSFETDDLPEITLPGGVAPFRPQGQVRQFLGHDDLGYEKR
jgi:hypothetical protein